ncbi:ATP-dependent metallopeptidase FtsH/Yme1/Tma family protein [Clostridium autoethanogenum]|uniref:AAA family ATPase n=1 Tax=Clostridium autoethanogenum DSM 10061 TaxID=1341692 RepID=A0ABM5NWN6_9CLOT|nr:AAA family ATPase [Clostridium autoethanogenum]AGY76917.1 AAA family ATPase [Clostridium autoethanogenum DSM 10061]ALU37063.1 ATP-dependent metalloprotease FtsH [Clostridium autoethanogenum DSM 10061]OVY48759.1 ATP-dependent zinc metalloprotease FtsH [Clostridium autoethanogenum]
MKKIKNKFIIIPILTSILSLCMLLFMNYSNSSVPYKSYISFQKDVSKKIVSTVYMTDSSQIRVKLKNGSIYDTDNPRTPNAKEVLLNDGISVSEQYTVNNRQAYPTAILIISIMAAVFMALKFSNKSSKKIVSLDSLDASAIEDSNCNFKSVAGNEEAKESVQDIVDFLKNPKKYASYGARMPKGILLFGEPGTGKTLLARAIAGEAEVPFYAVSGSDFVQVYVGVGASRIRQLFKKAKSNKSGKAVIFIDEIDAIGKKRDGSGSTGGSDERDQTLNALLTEMSGFNEKEGIVIIAATNRLDMLDPALLRPGRFDRHIEVTLPDVSSREKIISLHLKNKPVDNIDVHEWAQKTSYFSGAKIESLINEAAILACKEDSTYIENKHIDKAFSIVLTGYEKKDRDYIKDIDKRITAYHEVGHALVSSKVLPNEKISKITIIPSTKGAGGYTLSIPEDKLYQNKDYLRKRIMVLLGGRAAEEVIFGADYVTTGAYNDLQHSTNIAFKMVTQYGMGNTLGLLNMRELSDLNINQNEIIKECKCLTDSIYNDVKNILIENRHCLKATVQLLMEKETLFSNDLKNLFN